VATQGSKISSIIWIPGLSIMKASRILAKSILIVEIPHQPRLRLFFP
jgi:hypothetical protein